MQPNEILLNIVVPQIVSIIFGFIIYKKQEKTKKPVWTHKTIRLIGQKAIFKENIPISGTNNELCNISITKILFWNIGKEIIKKEDVKKEIVITFSEDNTILGEPKILQISREEACLSVTKRDNEISIDFEFLEQEDGCLVEIIHLSRKEPKRFVLPYSGRVIPDYARNTNEFLEYDFIHQGNANIIELEEDTGNSIQVNGTVLGVPNGIQLANVRKKGTRKRIAISAILLMISITLFSATIILISLSINNLITSQEVLRLISFAIISQPFSFMLLITVAYLPFVYMTARIIASIITFPPWFDYKYH